jgi:hypothetical protein
MQPIDSHGIGVWRAGGLQRACGGGNVARRIGALDRQPVEGRVALLPCHYRVTDRITANVPAVRCQRTPP